DHQRCHGPHVARGGRDGNQAGYSARHRAQGAWLPLPNPLRKSPREGRRGSGKMSSNEGTSRQPSSSHGAAGIKTKPPKPKQSGSSDGHRKVVWNDWFCAEAQPLSKDQRSNECRNPRADMHHCTTSEVKSSKNGARISKSEPPSPSPNPVG